MGLKDLFFSKSDADGDGQGGPVVCANNHVLDPGWNGVCPYCDAIARGDRTSMAPPEIEPPIAAAGNDRRTRVGPPAPPPQPAAASGRRETKVDSSDPSHMQRSSGDTRRITGVLATFSWTSTGELYAIREGKNTIGAGNLSEEGHRPCDVLIRTDPEVSKEHALILCRQGKYELIDLISSNGTFLNGQMISTHAVEIPNNAKIKVGATVFQFLMVDHRHVPGQPTMPPSRPEEDFEPTPRGRPGGLTSIG